MDANGRSQRTAIAALASLLTLAVLAWAGAVRAQTASDADALFAAGDFDRAATAYAQALTVSANDPAANAGLAAIELYRNQLPAAQTNAQRALVADPGNQRAGRVLTEAERRQTDWAKKTSISGEADVPFLVTDPLPVIRVRVNGTREATMLIDTGAGNVTLDPGFARELGLATEDAGTGTFAGGKTATLRKAHLDVLRLSNAVAYDLDATILPTRGMQLIPNVTLDGIVGTGLFERFLATLDYPHARLVLRARSASISTAFQAAARGAGATIVPAWLVGDHFVFARAQVNAAPPGLFLFDSGLAGGGLAPSAQLVEAARIKLDQAHAGTGVGGGGSVPFVPFTADRIAVGSAVQNQVPGLYTPGGWPLSIFPFAAQGTISHDFLKHYAFTVDFDAMTLVLQ